MQIIQVLWDCGNGVYNYYNFSNQAGHVDNKKHERHKRHECHATQAGHIRNETVVVNDNHAESKIFL